MPHYAETPLKPVDQTGFYSDLTGRQREVLAIYEQAHLENLDAPTTRAIQRIMDFRSPNGAIAHRTALVKKGFLEIQPRRFYGESDGPSARFRLTQAVFDHLANSPAH